MASAVPPIFSTSPPHAGCAAALSDLTRPHAGDWPVLPGEPSALFPPGLAAGDPRSLLMSSRYFPVQRMNKSTVTQKAAGIKSYLDPGRVFV